MVIKMNLTAELLAKAKEAKSVEELLAIAKENGIALTEEEAAKYFAELNKEGEIANDELDNVSGGCGNSYDPHTDPHIRTEMLCCACGYWTIWQGKWATSEAADCPGCGAPGSLVPRIHHYD